MPTETCEHHSWTCRWSRVSGPVIDGRAISAPVWICEFPYRTMLAAPPAPGSCAGCPLREQAAPAAEFAPAPLRRVANF
jgi:hypothetical protein